MNGGRCTDKLGGFSCSCSSGFTGRYCEADIDECASNPCNGEGSLACVQLNNNYKCACMEGWEGKGCEVRMQNCPREAVVCENGGYCLKHRLNQTVCVCPEVCF